MYASTFTTGHGDLITHGNESEHLSIVGISHRLGEFKKYQLAKRSLQELIYGVELRRMTAELKPDVVIGCNEPLVARASFLGLGPRKRPAHILWMQDIYYPAIALGIQGKVGIFATKFAARLEGRLTRTSEAVVAISRDFLTQLEKWDVPASAVTVLANWAPLDEMFPLEGTNNWHDERGWGNENVLLYSGTLGIKHETTALQRLASQVQEWPDTRLCIIGSGPGIEDIAIRTAGLDRVDVMDLQPYERLNEVLNAGTICLAILSEVGASISVPSKVLSYLAAGRPIIAILPGDNDAAELIEAAGAGVVLEPGNNDLFAETVRSLLDDEDRRTDMAKAARSAAEERFSVAAAADEFERVAAESIRIRKAR